MMMEMSEFALEREVAKELIKAAAAAILSKNQIQQNGGHFVHFCSKN